MNSGHNWDQELLKRPLPDRGNPRQIKDAVDKFAQGGIFNSKHKTPKKRRSNLLASATAGIAAVAIATAGVFMLSTHAFIHSNATLGDSNVANSAKRTLTPFNQLNMKQLSDVGLTVKDIGSQNENNSVIALKTVMNRTNQLYHNTGATTRHIWLVSASSQIADKYRAIPKKLALGDPNLQASHNTLKDIPCFLVVIHATTAVQSAGGTPEDGSSPVIISPTRDFYILIDAANGNTLLTFSVTKHAPSNEIPVNTKP